MNRARPCTLLVALLLPLLTAAAPPSGGPYVLRRQALAGGGIAAAGSVRLASSVAQPEAARMTGGSYRLTAGLLARAGAAAPTDRLFADSFE